MQYFEGGSDDAGFPVWLASQHAAAQMTPAIGMAVLCQSDKR